MPKLSPTDWQTLDKIFRLDGWVFKREKGSHRSYTKAGYFRAVVIPKYDEVGVDVISSNMRTARMDRDRYFMLLSKI